MHGEVQFTLYTDDNVNQANENSEDKKRKKKNQFECLEKHSGSKIANRKREGHILTKCCQPQGTWHFLFFHYLLRDVNQSPTLDN